MDSRANQEIKVEMYATSATGRLLLILHSSGVGDIATRVLLVPCWEAAAPPLFLIISVGEGVEDESVGNDGGGKGTG